MYLTKEKQKDTYKAESGKGFFLMVSEQYQKVKERNNNGFSAFPSIVTMRIDSLIKKPENIHKLNQYNGTSIENKKGILLPYLFRHINSWDFSLVKKTSVIILNRAEAVMAQFLLLFLYSQKKAVIYPKIKKKDINENG